jgi:RecA-family ATPase
VEQIAHSVVRYEPEEAQQVVDAAQVFKPVEVEEKPFTPGFTLTKADVAMSKEYEDTPWIVDGLMPAITGYTLLNSKPKVGKSTFARALAVAVSNGSDFLGKPTVQMPVMYVSFPFEGDEEQNAKELKKLGKEAPNLWVSGTWERTVSRDDVIQTLVHYSKQIKPRLIIVDTVMKLLRMKDVKDYAEVQEVLAPLYHVLEPLGSHFLFLHHEKKGGVDDVIESGLGSIGLAGSAETVLGRDDRRALPRATPGRLQVQGADRKARGAHGGSERRNPADSGGLPKRDWRKTRRGSEVA